MQTQEPAGGSCSTLKGHLTPVVILPHVTLHTRGLSDSLHSNTRGLYYLFPKGHMTTPKQHAMDREYAQLYSSRLGHLPVGYMGQPTGLYTYTSGGGYVAGQMRRLAR